MPPYCGDVTDSVQRLAMWEIIGGLTGVLAAAPGIWLLYVGRRDRLRSQAEQVTAWSVREVRSDEAGRETPPTGVVVVNTSSSEVRDVAVKVLSRADEKIDGKRYNAIAPGSYYLKYDDEGWSAPSALTAESGYLSLADVDPSTGAASMISMLPITEAPPEQYVAFLQFRTSNGRRWVRLAGGEVEPEYLVKRLSPTDKARPLQRLGCSISRAWRSRWNPQLRADLAAVDGVISDWIVEFDRTEKEPTTKPTFAPRVTPQSNEVAATLRRALATLVESDAAERDRLLKTAPERDNPHHLEAAKVTVADSSVLPPAIVAVRATKSPGRSLIFMTDEQAPRSNVYYFSVNASGTMPAEFFYGDLRKGYKQDNVSLTKNFVKTAEERDQPRGGTVKTWHGHESELMATIAAVITEHDRTRTAVPS